MYKYTNVDYENKESLKKFYSFYQNILLRTYGFDAVGPYAEFIKKIRHNKNYHAIIISDEANILAGTIFSYTEKTNDGLIEYLIAEKEEKTAEEEAEEIATRTLNALAKQNGFESANIIANTSKQVKETYTVSSNDRDDYFSKTAAKTLEKRATQKLHAKSSQ